MLYLVAIPEAGFGLLTTTFRSDPGAFFVQSGSLVDCQATICQAPFRLA